MDHTELLKRVSAIIPGDIDTDALERDITGIFREDLQGNLTISMEECAELCKEISKIKRQYESGTAERIYTIGLSEEIADVLFCIIGLLDSLNIDPGMIMAILRAKTDRAIERRNKNG